MAQTKAREVEAFCVTCPSTEEVTTLLQTLGFELAFHMDIDHPPEYEQVPCLPAQFHFQDEHGNEVIFLAGRDVDLDGVGFPEHASRFWLYPGADRAVYGRVANVLAVRWSLTWRSLSKARQDVA
jgi:signal recognition particle subunit SEC65